MARRLCSYGTSVARGAAQPARPNNIPRICWSRQIAGARLRIARFALLAFASCALSAFCWGGDIPEISPRPTGPVAQIPFKAYQDYLIVAEGRIGNLEHQNLLVDTGTNPSMIDRRVAAELGLQATSRDLSLFNKKVVSETVLLPKFEFGPLRRQNLQVMVADFSAIGRGLGTRIDAVIGLDVLGASNFTIDYKKRRISFGASVEHHNVPFSAGQQFITVNLKSGSRELHLLLDTGTPRLVLFESHLRDVDLGWMSGAGSGNNLTGNVEFKAIVLHQARIGTLEVGPQPASVVPSQHDYAGNLDGLMGVSCLRPKRISFDFEKQLLGWSD